LTAGRARNTWFSKNSTATISELQAKVPHFVREAEKQGALSIARHGHTVAFLVSRERMEAIIETLEIMGNPNAMKTIRAYEAGKVKFKDASCLGEDEKSASRSRSRRSSNRWHPSHGSD